jgi:anti-sigma factor RsiW
MKRVDQIIRYLSGELTPEESRALERELPVNDKLREEFDLVSAAYRLIGDELRRRDEEAFKSSLREVMDRGMPLEDRGSGKRKQWWYFMIPLAASIAALLVIFLPGRGHDKAYETFFNPASDPVILALNAYSCPIRTPIPADSGQ